MSSSVYANELDLPLTHRAGVLVCWMNGLDWKYHKIGQKSGAWVVDFHYVTQEKSRDSRSLNFQTASLREKKPKPSWNPAKLNNSKNNPTNLSKQSNPSHCYREEGERKERGRSGGPRGRKGGRRQNGSRNCCDSANSSSFGPYYGIFELFSLSVSLCFSLFLLKYQMNHIQKVSTCEGKGVEGEGRQKRGRPGGEARRGGRREGGRREGGQEGKARNKKGIAPRDRGKDDEFTVTGTLENVVVVTNYWLLWLSW